MLISEFLNLVKDGQSGLFYIDAIFRNPNISDSWAAAKAADRKFDILMVFPDVDLQEFETVVSENDPGRVLMVSLLDPDQADYIKERLKSAHRDQLIGVLTFHECEVAA